MANEKISWEWEINSKTSWLGTSFRELLSYKDLLLQLVRRNFILYYQQTLLGPLWMLINPLLTVLVYMLIFNRVIGVPTQGVPAFAFYLAGITLWTLFNDILGGTSNFLTANASVFSKVYFPRLVIPLSTTLLHLLRFLIQVTILVIVVLYYHFTGKIDLSFPRVLLFIPVAMIMAGISLGMGLIFSVVVAKYKDVSNLMLVLTRLLMFLCPVFYSASIVPANLQWLIKINPMSSLFEHFRFAFLGTGSMSPQHLLYSFTMALVLLTAGVMLTNKMGDKLLDVV